MLKIGQTSHTLFADESDVVIPWTALQARSQKLKSPLLDQNLLSKSISECEDCTARFTS